MVNGTDISNLLPGLRIIGGSKILKRKKSKFEKFFSYSRHKRRFGASKAIKANFDENTFKLKETIIEGKDINYTHGSEVSITKHIENLKEEFIGESALCHYHASLIVLIRREVNIKTNISLFEELWQNHKIFLLDKLNTRWLVSASDTFLDHSSNPIERACALAISTLINTVKLSETEEVIRPSANIDIDYIKSLNLHDKRFPLWDGTSAFAVGTDDTLRNLRWRIDEFVSKYGDELVTPNILNKVFMRLQENETIYKRFKDLHHRDRTGWW